MGNHFALLTFALLSTAMPHSSQRPENTWDSLLHSSQASWTEEALAAARADLASNPEQVLSHLVDQLADGTGVDGSPLESTRYTVCGNALTLLEDLTHVRIDSLGRDWFGFRTHDHRACEPSAEEIEMPWRAWLAVRSDVPVKQWFWGLAYSELEPVAQLLTSDPKEWRPSAVAHAAALGPRLYPFLIEKLLDDEFSANERVADRADQLLRRLTGKSAGTLLRHELLNYDPRDPLREQSTHLNRASMQLVQQRWVSILATSAK